MKKLTNMVNTIGAIETEFGLDILDLYLIIAANSRWEENLPIRITDLVRDFKIASPATIHYRVTDSLVKKKMFTLKRNPEDRREKLIMWGPKIAALEKFLGEK